MMPKKKNEESPEDQFKRFQKAVKDMVDAGELNSREAERQMEKVMGNISIAPPERENSQ